MSFEACFTDGTGATITTAPGDWLVVENAGSPAEEQCIMDNAEFISLYEPLKKQGRKIGSRNQTREEVESSGDAICVDGQLALA